MRLWNDLEEMVFRAMASIQRGQAAIFIFTFAKQFRFKVLPMRIEENEER